MKKISYLFVVLCLLFINLNNASALVEKPKIYLFHLDGCPHCAEAREYIRSTLMEEYPDIELIQYEVGPNNSDNNNFLDQIQAVNGNFSNSVPYIMVGAYSRIGFNSSVKDELHDAVQYYINGNIELNVPELVKNGTLTQENYVSYINEYSAKADENIANMEKTIEDSSESIEDEQIAEESNTSYLIPILGIGFVLVLGTFMILKNKKSH